MNEDVENDMKTLHQNSSIRIGASVTVGAHVLPRLVSYYEKMNPQTDIEVFEDNTEKIENRILRDQIDIGIVEGETTSLDVLNRAFMDDELVLICSSCHRFACLSAIEPHELEHEKFIIREKGSGTRKTFEDSMTDNHLTWYATWTCNNADTIKMAVAEGLGISVISGRAVASEVASGLLCQTVIKGIQLKRQFKIIYHKNKYLTKSMKQFIDLCISNSYEQI